jgi:hypothetical protein
MTANSFDEKKKKLVSDYIEKGKNRDPNDIRPFDTVIGREKEWLNLLPKLWQQQQQSTGSDSDIDGDENNHHSDNDLNNYKQLARDATTFLNYLEYKASLRILEQTPLAREEPPCEVLSELMAVVGKSWKPLSHDKYHYDFNVFNETLRERTGRILSGIGVELMDTAVHESLSEIAKEVIDWQRKSMKLMANGTLRGVIRVHEGNRRFLQTSGKWHILHGIIEDFACRDDRHTYDDWLRVFDQVRQQYIHHPQRLLDELKLKIVKEDIRSVAVKVSTTFLNKDSAKLKERVVLYQTNRKENASIQQKRQARRLELAAEHQNSTPLILWQHHDGCIDVPALEVIKAKEKNHVQAIRFLRASAVQPAKIDGKATGMITCSLLFADQDSKSTLMVLGTSLGRLLCYRISWTSQKSIEFLGCNLANNANNGPHAVMSIRCGALDPLHIVTINKVQVVTVWSLRAILQPIVLASSNAVVAQKGLFSCFRSRPTKTKEHERIVEKIGQITENELQYRFRADLATLQMYGNEDETDEKLREKETKDYRRRRRKRQNKTLLAKVFDSLQPQQDLPSDERIANCVGVFGAMNELGQSTSLVIGTSDGEIFKFNLDVHLKQFLSQSLRPCPAFMTREFINPTMSPEGFVLTATQIVSHDGGGKAQNRKKVAHNKEQTGNKVFRELFHSRSHGAVTSMATIDQESCAMLSIDDNGIVCQWRYDQDHMAGSGWLEPHIRRTMVPVLVTFEPRADQINETADSLTDLLNSEVEQQMFHKTVQVSHISYRESSLIEKKQRSKRISPNGSAIEDDNTQISPRTQRNRHRKRSPRRDRVERFFEINRIYHSIRDEENEEDIRFEESITLSLVQQSDQLLETSKSNSTTPVDKVLIDGVQYILKDKQVKWRRFIVDCVKTKLSMIGHKISHDGLELIFLYRLMKDENVETVGDAGTSTTFVAASLNTHTLHLRQPLTFFSLSGEEIVDFVVGPIMKETLTRVLILLTTQGLHQYSLHTGQELFFAAKALTSGVSLASNASLLSDPRHCFSTLSFRPNHIDLCSSQRVLLLTSDKEARFEVLLLSHDLDGTKAAESTPPAANTFSYVNSKDDEKDLLPLSRPWSDIFQMLDGQDMTPKSLFCCPGNVLVHRLESNSVSTIIDQIVSDSMIESSEAAKFILEYLLELLEDEVDLKANQKKRFERIQTVLSEQLGYIPPTIWPPSKVSKLDRLIAHRIEWEEVEREEEEHEEDERVLMAAEDERFPTNSTATTSRRNEADDKDNIDQLSQDDSLQIDNTRSHSDLSQLKSTDMPQIND